jgi:predicted RNA methylase
MKGFVPTPPETADAMVELLFRERLPGPYDRVPGTGCGTGAFIEGIIRWCAKHDLAVPRVTGVESDPRHMAVLRNPPYVAITGLSQAEKQQHRAGFATARGRFDL